MLGVRTRWATWGVVLAAGSLLLAACPRGGTFADLPATMGAETEECLVDFAKKIEGHRLAEGPLPAGLDASQFFRLLAPDYPDQTCLRRVQAFPVQVEPRGESYRLVLCDPTRRWALYEDWGETLDRVDHPYVRQRVEVACPLK